MRDPHDPAGEYERCGCEAWTSQDYIDYVTGRMKTNPIPKPPKSIADRIIDMVRARELFGMKKYGKAFDHETYNDNPKQAREELLDALFYTMAALVALMESDDA